MILHVFVISNKTHHICETRKSYGSYVTRRFCSRDILYFSVARENHKKSASAFLVVFRLGGPS